MTTTPQEDRIDEEIVTSEEEQNVRAAEQATLRKELGENVEQDPRLSLFKADYDSWSENIKARCSWEEVRRRLLKDNGHQLELARDMEQGGVLFGVDEAGQPLVADKCDGPIMCDMNYSDTRQAVRFKKGENDEEIPTGYEMFPYAGYYDKSPEILAFEQFTGKPFVVSPDRKEWRSSWLESGDTPSDPCSVSFVMLYGCTRVNLDRPGNHNPNLGVRRLLRVKS